MLVRRSVAGLLAMLFAVVAPAAAQHHQHGSRVEVGMCPDSGPRGARAAMPGPDVLLDHADELQLTGEQIARLNEVDQEATALREEAMALHARHRAALMEAIQAELPDRSAVRTHFDAAHAAMGQAHWLAMDVGLQAAAILTEEQRALAKTWAAAEPCCGAEQRPGAARQGKMGGGAACGDGCRAGAGRP